MVWADLRFKMEIKTQKLKHHQEHDLSSFISSELLESYDFLKDFRCSNASMQCGILSLLRVKQRDKIPYVHLPQQSPLLYIITMVTLLTSCKSTTHQTVFELPF